jgi:hypothetical protein
MSVEEKEGTRNSLTGDGPGFEVMPENIASLRNLGPDNI